MIIDSISLGSLGASMFWLSMGVYLQVWNKTSYDLESINLPTYLKMTSG